MPDHVQNSYQEKGPNAIKSWRWDWSGWLTSLGADTIATSTFTVPTGLTKVAEANTTTTATVKLSGGTDGESYSVTNHITTAGGDTEEASMYLKIVEQ